MRFLLDFNFIFNLLCPLLGMGFIRRDLQGDSKFVVLPSPLIRLPVSQSVNSNTSRGLGPGARESGLEEQF